MRDGTVLLADKPPVAVLGKWVVVIDGRSRTIDGSLVETSALDTKSDDCACWRELDETPLVGEKFPVPLTLPAAAAATPSGYAFVEVFASYCGACYATIKEADRHGRSVSLVSISGGDAQDRARWMAGLTRIGLKDSPRWRHQFLDGERFDGLMRELQLKGDAGRSFIVDREGRIVHARVCWSILDHVLKRLPAPPATQGEGSRSSP